MKTSNTLIVIAGAVAIYLVIGCSSKPIPSNLPEKSEVKNEAEKNAAVVAIEPSFASLADPLSKSVGIPWKVALTLAEISKVTYDDEEDQVSSIKKLGAVTVRPIVVGLSHGVVASDDNAVVIGFRGTKAPADWLTDATIIGRQVSDGKIHRGFYHVVDAIYKEVFDEAVRQGAKSKTVWITGHSLGGAMAVVFAHRGATESELAPEGIITFGQPLAVSSSLAQFFLDTFNTRYIRFVNNWDAVPRLLPNYRHAGSRVYLKEGGFTFRSPVMAVSAPAPGSTPANAPAGVAPSAGENPLYLFDENEPDLQPMTQEEFEAFQQQVQSENIPRVAAAGAPPVRVASGAVGMSIPIPWLEAHSMLLYIERIKDFGEKELNQH